MSNQYIEPLHVTGRVLNPDGSPVVGAQIEVHKRIFDKALSEGANIVAWGTATTDSKGAFDVYTYEGDVDVAVVAVDPNNNNATVAASPTLYGVRGLVEIDLVVSGEENYVGPTEFERVESAITAHLAGSSVTYASADDAHVRDLAGLTKIDPVRVSACVLANRLHSEASTLGLLASTPPYYPLPIPSVAALYAIVVSEVARTLDDVRLMEAAARDAVLVRAGEQRIIASLSSTERAQIHAFFAELQATKAIAAGGNLGTTLGDILTIPTVDLDNQQLRDFYDRYTQRTGTVADFWTALEAAPGFDSNLVKRVQFALALATVTGMHSQATQAIALEFQLPSATLANIADRTAVDWYAWLNSKQIEPPASIDGSSLSERRQNYANRMASIIEHALPTAVLRARMADDTQSDEGGVRAFLDATPEFDFASHRFSRYVREKSLNLSSIGDAETIKREATAVQRLFSIVPAVNRMNNIRALRGCGFDSAAKIVGAGKRRFLAQMNTWGVDASVARSIFREAGRSAAAAVAIYADRSQAFRRGALPVTREDDALSEFAELSSMFGSLDGCDCGACRSAFGAAAYLTDLLFFLEQCDGAGVTRSGAAVPTGLDAIKARRPDLSKIKLSCENSNHKLPAIDLAIEALEVEVERLSLGVVADAVYDRQTTGSEAALRLAPEHRRDAAYAALAAASTPWSLPYHRETDASLSYLRLSGVHPADLVRTVYLQASIDRGEFARLELGMSSAEFALLASDDAQSPKDLWGYPSGIPTSIPLRTFLDRTGCTLDEALQIVACRYPNQGQIAAEPATVDALTIDIANCSIDDEASVVAKMYPERARRIYRLVRLQRRTGRSLSELDTVLSALGEPAVPVTPAPAAGAMIRFAEAIALQRAFGFSAEELAAIAKARTDYASELARGSAFARALGLSPTDATTLSSRLEVTSGAARTENDPFGWASDELERMRAIVDGRVSVAALDEFLRHEGPAANASIPTDAALTASWNAIRASKSNASESTERAIIEECSRVLRAPEPVVDYLCKSCFAVGGASLFDAIVADASESAPSYFEDALRRATKLVALRSLLGVDDDAFEHFVRWLKRRGFAFDAIAIEVCEDHPEGLVEHIVEAAKAKVICDSLGLRSASLYEVLAVVPETGAIDRIAFEARVAALLGAQPALIYHVTDKLGITANSIGGAVPWRSTRGIEAVRRALRLMNATGATQIDALQSWMSFSTQSIADAIASAARAKLGDDAFASAAIAAADAMRTRQRDALVAYLVHALGLRSAGDLYTRLLVDVEMSPCMLTTRVLHATSCVQNLLQRASMNLDAAAKWTELETKPAMARVTLTSDDARTWGWMKNYRVWEAARRVLLYPENYVEPELRTDATPAFDDLTRVLEQGDLDERATENAFRAYLRSLEEVSSLDVCAMTVEPRGDKHKIFHVFGRTRTTPRTYHYCSYDSLSGWTAWQATKLDVGDSHIVPVVFAGRLYVYWPVFIEQAIEGAIERLADGESKRHKKRWEVRIAGARFEDQRWTQPFVSECSCATQSLVQKARVSILPKIGPGSLELILSNTNFFDQLESPTSDYREVFGAMETNDGVFFRKSNREASLVHNRQYTAPPATDLLESRLINDGSVAALSVPFVDSAGSVMVRADVFGLTQRGFALVQPVESEHFVGVQPFFYADSERVYFLLPSPNFEVMARQLGKPSMITPENADRLLGEHDRSVMFELADGPRFGGHRPERPERWPEFVGEFVAASCRITEQNCSESQGFTHGSQHRVGQFCPKLSD